MMIKKFRSALVTVLILLSGFLFSQEVGIGEWRDNLPYVTGVSIAAGDGKVYCATPNSVFYLNKSDNSLNRVRAISSLPILPSASAA